jgi:hypothetical protein
VDLGKTSQHKHIRMAERPVEGTEGDICTQEVENIGSNRYNRPEDPLKS